MHLLLAARACEATPVTSVQVLDGWLLSEASQPCYPGERTNGIHELENVSGTDGGKLAAEMEETVTCRAWYLIKRMKQAEALLQMGERGEDTLQTQTVHV